MRPFFIIYSLGLILGVTVLGFRGCKSTRTPLEVFPDMDRQMKFHEQGRTGFFDDQRMDRQPVSGTVPHVAYRQAPYENLVPDNRFRENDYLVTGKLEDGSFGDGIPVEVSYENMKAGQQLYAVYCTICHGESGNGLGVIAQERYGYPTIASLLQARLIDLPDGDIYNTIAYGKNTMGAYGSKIRVEDRWKVTLYVRALQRAATATIEDVPAENRRDLGL